ncbi:MAG TPA: hypothetical protein PKN50_17625 [Spirochaetota bacterium]|nr:hypothetical protein [Spirochaetota bacterium]
MVGYVQKHQLDVMLFRFLRKLYEKTEAGRIKAVELFTVHPYDLRPGGYFLHDHPVRIFHVVEDKFAVE